MLHWRGLRGVVSVQRGDGSALEACLGELGGEVRVRVREAFLQLHAGHLGGVRT